MKTSEILDKAADLTVFERLSDEDLNTIRKGHKVFARVGER